MTTHRSFKRLVRARMSKTGESYVTARTRLLAGTDAQTTAAPPVLATSDAEILRRSGRGWEQWFDLLDEWGAADLAHREIARLVAGELHIEPLVWEAQAISLSYERARGGRAVGERSDGFTITASKTIGTNPATVFAAFADESDRAAWLADGALSLRTATQPKSLRFDWQDGATRVNVVIDPKGDAKSTVTVEHARLGDAAAADLMKTYWRGALASLASHIEAGDRDA